DWGWIKQLADAILLQVPMLPNAFTDLHYPSLNGSMWTVSYEFRCYLLVIALGLAGLFRNRYWLALFALVLLASSAFRKIDYSYSTTLGYLIGQPKETLRFTAIFLTGSAFYVFRDRISYRNDLACLAAIVLGAAMFKQATAEIAMPLAGGYLI